MTHADITIADAQTSDVRRLRELAVEVKIDAWSEAHYAEEIRRPEAFVIKATKSGRLVGFLLARTVTGTTEKPDADLYNIAVVADLQGRGIATSLLGELLLRLRKIETGSLWLEVRESNHRAIEFYERHGFETELTRPNFYTAPVENAVIMRLRLHPESDPSDALRMLDSNFEQE